MVIILDTTEGKSYHFKTRKDAGNFAGVTQPTLRGWLAHPFFLYKSFIITESNHEKISETKKILNGKAIRHRVNV
jgi:hypothetical protein